MVGGTAGLEMMVPSWPLRKVTAVAPPVSSNL